MKSLLLFLGLAAIPALGKHPAAAPDSIELYTHFQTAPSAAILTTLETEVESIMDPMGLSFHWHDLSAANGKQVSLELAVITLKGRCDLEGPAPAIVDSAALGWTHISDGTILPYADVDCDAIHGFLQKELAWDRPEDRPMVFAKAVGRVLAHELYHIFANTKRHGADGVGRESYSVQELIAPSFRFEERESTVLKNNLAHASSPNAEESDNGTGKI